MLSYRGLDSLSHHQLCKVNWRKVLFICALFYFWYCGDLLWERYVSDKVNHSKTVFTE